MGLAFCILLLWLPIAFVSIEDMWTDVVYGKHWPTR